MSDASSVVAPVQRTRQLWIDQARWVAIALVLIGHLVGPLRGRSGLAHAISDFVYVFHIPALVLLAGWGARRAKPFSGLDRVWWQLLLPYAIFQLIAFGFNAVFEGSKPSWSFIRPTFGLWFLVALAGWRLIGPLIRLTPAPVPLAIILALVAGMVSELGSVLALQRIAFFLPLFVAGPWVIDQISQWRRRRELRLLGLAVLAAGAATVLILQPGFNRRIFFGRDTYDSLQQQPLEGVAARLAALTIATVLAVALMLAIPQFSASSRLGALLAAGGRYTMYPYLLHLPFLTFAGWTGARAYGTPTVAAAVAATIGLLLAILFVSPPVRLLAQPFVEPRTWLDRLMRPRVRSG